MIFTAVTRNKIWHNNNLCAKPTTNSTNKLFMKFFSLIPVTLILACYSCGQETLDNENRVSIVHENGVKIITISNRDSSQKVSIAYDSTDAILYTTVATHNARPHSVEYFTNGRPKGLVNFDSTMSGHAVYYYDNGHIKSEGHWQNGKMNGVWYNYSTEGVIIKIDTLE